MSLPPARRHYAAIFVLSFCLLMLEIALARVLSVALLSHYAFVAISLAMFGIGLSGLAVYLFPRQFRPENVDRQLVTCSWSFALSAVLSVLVFLNVQVVQQLSFEGFLTLSLAYSILALPFFFGGVGVSLIMTHFSGSIGRVYCADLLGASLGCIVVVATMEMIPATHVPLLVGLLASATSLLLGVRQGWRWIIIPAVSSALVVHVIGSAMTTDLLKMRYVKQWAAFYSDYEAWNAFSRVSAFRYFGNATETLPLNERPSDDEADHVPNVMMLEVDGTAWTPIIQFTGDVSSIKFLRDSVLYAAHHLRPRADVLIIGTGGGRDILAGYVFGQRSMLGIEINPLMRHVVEERYGDFSGRPYTRLGAEVITDEARSRLSSLDRKFDIIQLSLIDTFSLNAAGGVVFSENYLYTTEAFRQYYRHLSEKGILSISRYFVPKYPLEVLRVAAMVREAWSAEGVAETADHIVVLGQELNATLLAKRSSYSQQEIEQIDQLAREKRMSVLYRPGGDQNGHAQLAALITSPSLEDYLEGHEFIIRPPTDDRPFFFHFLRSPLRDPPAESEDPFQVLRRWSDALSLMYLLIAIVTGLAAVFFLGPLVILRRGDLTKLPKSILIPVLLYFVCLGYGFMMIEIPLMQRFILSLGYPIYSLAVVLFALLLFSGVGSLMTARFTSDRRAAIRVLIAIIVVSAAYVYLLPSVTRAVMPLPIFLRIGLTVGLLAPIGLLLGMAYPLGIGVLRGFSEGLVPWAWGLNGAMSVVASVLATFIGSRFGFSAAMMTGVGAYGIALLCVGAAGRTVVDDVGSL